MIRAYFEDSQPKTANVLYCRTVLTQFRKEFEKAALHLSWNDDKFQPTVGFSNMIHQLRNIRLMIEYLLLSSKCIM